MLSQYIPKTTSFSNLQEESRPQRIFSLLQEGKNWSGDKFATGAHSKIKVAMHWQTI